MRLFVLSMRGVAVASLFSSLSFSMAVPMATAVAMRHAAGGVRPGLQIGSWMLSARAPTDRGYDAPPDIVSVTPTAGEALVTTAVNAGDTAAVTELVTTTEAINTIPSEVSSSTVVISLLPSPAPVIVSSSASAAATDPITFTTGEGVPTTLSTVTTSRRPSIGTIYDEGLGARPTSYDITTTRTTSYDSGLGARPTSYHVTSERTGVPAVTTTILSVPVGSSTATVSPSPTETDSHDNHDHGHEHSYDNGDLPDQSYSHEKGHVADLAAILVGVLIGIPLAAFLIWWFFYYRKSPRYEAAIAKRQQQYKEYRAEKRERAARQERLKRERDERIQRNKEQRKMNGLKGVALSYWPWGKPALVERLGGKKEEEVGKYFRF